MDECKAMREEFLNPPSVCRGKPFWAWNGQLEEGELRRQIRVMRDMGLGGFFMHSRTGLATPYLGDEWFRLVRACCDEAARHGLEAWLYDEDRWPSGSAGGLVTRDPRFRMRRLRMDIFPVDGFQWPDDCLCAFSARIDGPSAYGARRLFPGDSLSSADALTKVLVFTCVTVKERDAFNGQTYLDTLSREAVRAFIEVTHERYGKEVAPWLGNVCPGIFTDEPHHGGLMTDIPRWSSIPGPAGSVSAPWTNQLPEVFQERYGYDILDHLPAVFFDLEGVPVQRARHHFHDCRTHMFCDAFARQIGEWCEAKGMAHTGHLFCESPLSLQMAMVGSALRFYEHMQAPGIDILKETNYSFETAKQCASVQHQCGRRWMLSELYGVTGWGFSFEGHKAAGDWQAALGVNLRCQHLAWYTMEGEGKRDCPGSIHFQSPWWDQYRKVEDYFARVGVVMSRGAAVRRLLVVSPIESAWQVAKFGWQQRKEHRAFDAEVRDVTDWLVKSHIDFDFGDEEMLSRLGSIRSEAGKPRLIVGKASYDVMLIPPVTTIRSTTLALARRFLEAGGIVVMAGLPPDYVDAVRDSAARDLARTCVRSPFRRTAILKAVEPARTLSILDSKGREAPSILYLLHEEDGERGLFLCNIDRKKPEANITIRMSMSDGASVGNATAEEWDAETGNVYAAESRVDGQFLEIRTDFLPSGSRLFVLPKAPGSELARRPMIARILDEAPLKGPWEYTLSEPNALPLDRARFRIGAGPWQDRREVLKIDQAVRDALGIDHRGGNMVQPWARADSDLPPKRVAVDMEFPFLIRDLPSAAVDLAIERPERYRIRLNGHEVRSGEGGGGWWVDPSLRRLGLQSAWLRAGRNLLTLAIDYSPDDGLEALFLRGHFGVDIRGEEPEITKPPHSLKVGDWVAQGLPFYSGNVLYRRRIRVPREPGERVFVALPRFAGACARVVVDGRAVDTLAWPPYEADITGALVGEEAELGIEVYGSRRNAFGPLHWNTRTRIGTGPGQFLTEGAEWTDRYVLEPYGLLKAPILRRAE
ncbi:MAG: glycosyl hydrolase [Candidatus Sumerlaeota bacterium]|nr:glycosyl hydrolase [Candidatus Sumerlaeota bacterium]